MSLHSCKIVSSAFQYLKKRKNDGIAYFDDSISPSSGLILLKMLSEYIDMNSFLSALSPEIVHRAVQILKFFNTRTCQLVLGAGAMQVPAV